MPLNFKYIRMNDIYLKRFIEQDLQQWAAGSNRKPLLLRGARQAGKTTVIRKLAESFENYLEVNFEEHKDIHVFFERNLSPEQITENLSLYFNVPVKESKTLLFFDEVQACVPALASLRFFYEKKPGLHLVAAGSMLEFALRSIPSFGVGRIRSLFMYPMSLDEFLMACGEEELVKTRWKHNPFFPMDEALHNKLIRYLKKFMILGGMPEVIKQYIMNSDIVECQRVLDDLILSYLDDFAKYKDKVPVSRLSDVFRSLVPQLGQKLVLSKISSDCNYHQLKEALDLLIKAGLVIPVTHSSANGIPLGAEAKKKHRKMLIFDTGIAQRMAGLNVGELLTENPVDFINKGGLAELFAGLEIIKASSPFERSELYFWQREALNSNAEVDYLLQKGTGIIPVEVKAGTKGAMQSLQIFLKEKKIERGIRVSLENFSAYQNILVYPLYAVRDLLSEQDISRQK